MQYKRSLRVAGFLKKEISDILMREVKDPAIKMVTITKITVTDDLKIAKVYVNMIGPKELRNDMMHGLERAKKFIRSEIGHRADLKYIPELFFYYDDTADYVESIDSLIKKIHMEDK